MAKKKDATLEPRKSDIGKDERMYIKLENLLPNPYQPPSRCNVDMLTAQKFGQSILEHGLLQMPVVRLSKTEGLFEVGDGWLRLSGYRWLQDHNHLEYKEMPVVLRGFTDQEMADLILEANGVRNDLNPIELAWYYRKYLSDFKKVTQEEFAKKHQKSQSEVANTMRLLELPDEVQQKIICHEITESHGRALLPLKDKALIIRFMEDAIFEGWPVSQLSAKVKAHIEKQSPKLIPEEPKVEPVTAVEKETHTCDHNCDDCTSECNSRQEPAASAAGPEVVTESGKEGGKTEDQQVREKAPCSKCHKPFLKIELHENGLCPFCWAKVDKLPVKPEAKPTGTPKMEKPVPIGAKTWKRKLVVEEVEGGVNVSVMAEGKFPVIKKYTDHMYGVVRQLPEFLDFAAEQWKEKE